MKEVICLLAVLLTAGVLLAQENKNLLSIGAGVALPMGNVADSVFTDVDTGEIKWGKGGGNIEFQYLHFINERWALGVELKRTETDLVSLEARYHMARLKEQDISATYKYVTVMLKAGGLF